jgi:Nuclease-related domain
MNPSIDAATAFALVSSPAFPVLSWHEKDIVVGRRDLFPAVPDGEISFPVEICQDELVPMTHPSEDPDDLVREIGFHVRFSGRLSLCAFFSPSNKLVRVELEFQGLLHKRDSNPTCRAASNIFVDHLVLSKGTGLFLIETKAHGGRVNVVNGELRVNQRPPEKDFVAQAVRNTAWLREQLEAKLSTKIWIEPILVFANAYVERCQPIRNVQIVPKIYLLRTIRKRSRSHGASKLWENKEILSEIFPSIWFPPKTDFDPQQSAEPPVRQDRNNGVSLPQEHQDCSRH